MLRDQLLGALRLPALLAALTLMALVTVLVVVAWHGLNRLEPVREHLTHLRMLQELTDDVASTLADSGRVSPEILGRRTEDLRTALGRLATLERHRDEQTPDRLQMIDRTLADVTLPADRRLASALSSLHSLQSRERRAQAGLLEALRRDARFELELAALLLAGIPIAAAGLAYLMRDRIWRPLDNLAMLLDELSAGQYRQIPEAAMTGSSSALEPVYRNYNTLVSRLQALELEHRQRENTLEQEVRAATEALLDLNQQLAESQRLAAVGTLAAGFAHELRNPLAGIRMACKRLHDNSVDAGQKSRLSLVLEELDRLSQLLNTQLAHARHAPEPDREIALSECVDSLLALVRYQVPDYVRVHARVDDEVRCWLPVGELRQALLNLVLNSAQAIGGQPGSITVAARAEDDRIVIVVTDDGPGFPAAVLDAPTRTFVTAREGGTGLGLASVRRFAQDRGGSVTLSNIEPHGARVTIVVPARVEHA